MQISNIPHIDDWEALSMHGFRVLHVPLKDPEAAFERRQFEIHRGWHCEFGVSLENPNLWRCIMSLVDRQNPLRQEIHWPFFGAEASTPEAAFWEVFMKAKLGMVGVE